MKGFAIAFGLLAAPALAALPPDADPTSPLHNWFEHQFSVQGTWCCDVSDGHVLNDDEWRATADGFEVRIAGVWQPIPNDTLRDPKGGPNPTGRAVIWFTKPNDRSPVYHIYCFAPGTLY